METLAKRTRNNSNHQSERVTPGRSTFGVARAIETLRSEVAHGIIYNPDAPRNAPAKSRWALANQADRSAQPSQVQQVPKPGAQPLQAPRQAIPAQAGPVQPKAPVKAASAGRRASALTAPAQPAIAAQPKGEKRNTAEASKPKQTQTCHARPTATKGDGSGRSYTGQWCKK